VLFISGTVPGEGTPTGTGITLFRVSTEIAPRFISCNSPSREAVAYLSGRFFPRDFLHLGLLG